MELSYGLIKPVFSRRRKSSPDHDVDMSPTGSETGSDDIREDQEMDTMDEHMAAMVLTNLSCSPQSPHFPIGFIQDTGIHHTWFLLI